MTNILKLTIDVRTRESLKSLKFFKYLKAKCHITNTKIDNNFSNLNPLHSVEYGLAHGLYLKLS